MSLHDRHVAVPRPATRALGAAASGLGLPPELEREAADRLGRIAWVLLGLSLLVLLLSNTIPRIFELPASVVDAQLASNPSRILGSLTALCLALVMRYGHMPVRRKLAIGQGLVLLLIFAIALEEATIPVDFKQHYRGVAAPCILILFVPLLVPARPKAALLVALAGATAIPLAYGVMALAGNPMPGLPLMLRITLPGYVCAGMAWFGASVIYRLGTDVQRARQLGSYALENRIGRGGMGEVWRARHGLLARPAAIKLIRSDELATDPARAELLMRQFRREAEATAALRSPHTVELYDFGFTDDGTFYFAMELLDGCDLERLVELTGPVPPERAIHLLLGACHSLSEAHGRGLTHRDIKPANLFATRLGEDFDVLKVLDFGLVRERDVADPEHQLELGGEGQTTIKGTPSTMAPEQVLGRGDIDGRADIYALGCVAYWLLTGVDVFEGQLDVQLLFAHVHAEPERLSARAKQPIPEALEQVVLDCLRKDRAERPQTARELARRLEAVPLAAEWTQARAAAWWAREGARLGGAAAAPTATHAATTDVDPMGATVYGA
ncbi:MAG: serine/threonine-protein kinase [Myxococcota bacterium]